MQIATTTTVVFFHTQMESIFRISRKQIARGRGKIGPCRTQTQSTTTVQYLYWSRKPTDRRPFSGATIVSARRGSAGVPQWRWLPLSGFRRRWTDEWMVQCRDRDALSVGLANRVACVTPARPRSHRRQTARLLRTSLSLIADVPTDDHSLSLECCWKSVLHTRPGPSTGFPPIGNAFLARSNGSRLIRAGPIRESCYDEQKKDFDCSKCQILCFRPKKTTTARDFDGDCTFFTMSYSFTSHDGIPPFTVTNKISIK